uniref:killer cell lectin-like receptor 2 isoform X2 n=1 Tax=Myodes glareolus TaxID=447135 RepID=UPI00202028C9|nr:killer cell lectin-like receptor 2 isoform X2 [Myodes glareolus]
MMRDQQVIYSNSRVYESFSESQSPARQDETQGPRDVGHKVALGILCLLLMTAIAVWLTYIFQNKYEPMKCQNNLDQSTVQNTSFLNKTLTNKSSDSEGCKNQEGLNRCCGKTKAVVDYGKYTGKCAEAHLLCCGMKCYYFIMDNKRWNDCKLTCQDCSLSFLKIDDDDERSACYTRKGNRRGFAICNPEVRLSEMSNWMIVENVTDLWANLQNGVHMRTKELNYFSG